MAYPLAAAVRRPMTRWRPWRAPSLTRLSLCVVCFPLGALCRVGSVYIIYHLTAGPFMLELIFKRMTATHGPLCTDSCMAAPTPYSSAVRTPAPLSLSRGQAQHPAATAMSARLTNLRGRECMEGGAVGCEECEGWQWRGERTSSGGEHTVRSS